MDVETTNRNGVPYWKAWFNLLLYTLWSIEFGDLIFKKKLFN